MNKTLIKFTLLSACLDPLKLLYVCLIAFVMPIGMKVASLLHGASDSQTFEMLTGKVGVAFVLMVLCLGLAGNSSTQSGRGGEYLPLIFVRPITRSQYVMSKWITVTLIGGGLAALQNLLIAVIGYYFGETISAQAVVSMIIERILDAGLISAAMILTMLYKNPAFQVTAIMAFYVWLTGQTIPPVSVAGAGGIQDMSISATKMMMDMSQLIGQLILPNVNVYDLITGSQFSLSPILAYVCAVVLYLTFSIAVIIRREFFYGTT